MESAERKDQQLEPKTVLDERFEIEFVLATTATATLYRARHLLLDKTVLVKVLHEECKESASFQRFQRELNALSKLGHANIVTAYATGIYQNHPYLVTEQTDAHTLADLIGKKTAQDVMPQLDLEAKRSIICQICDALAHLHLQGIVHRDLRPENILVSSDLQYAKLTDFEFAKFSSIKNEMRVTKTGEMIGSASYASPEQLSGAPVDPRSDLFSLGCLIYELFTDEAPLKDGIPFAVSPEKEPATNLKLSKPLQTCVNRLLQKKAEARFAHAEEVKLLIQKAKLTGTVQSKQAPIWGLAAAVLLIVGISFFALHNTKKELPKAGATKHASGAPLSVQERFSKDLDEGTKALVSDNTEQVFVSSQDLISIMPQIKLTESRIEQLGTYMSLLENQQYYDLLADIAAEGAERGLKQNDLSTWMLFAQKEGHCLDSTGQFDLSLKKFCLLLESDFAKLNSTNLGVLNAMRGKAQALEHLILEKQSSSEETQKMEAEINRLLREMDTIERKPAEADLTIKQAHSDYRQYISDKKKGNAQRLGAGRRKQTADFVETVFKQMDRAQGKPSSKNDSPEEKKRRKKSMEEVVASLAKKHNYKVLQGYLYNIAHAFKAADLINNGVYAEADALADSARRFFARRPYSEFLSNILGDLTRAYGSQNQTEKALLFADSRSQYEQTNPNKNEMSALLGCSVSKGAILEKANRYDEALQSYMEGLQTKYAKHRPTDSRVLNTRLSIARVLKKKGDPNSRKKAVAILTELDKNESDVDPKDDKALKTIKQAREQLKEILSTTRPQESQK